MIYNKLVNNELVNNEEVQRDTVTNEYACEFDLVIKCDDIVVYERKIHTGATYLEYIKLEKEYLKDIIIFKRYFPNIYLEKEYLDIKNLDPKYLGSNDPEDPDSAKYGVYTTARP